MRMGERESVKSVWGSGFMGEGGEMALGVRREWSEMEEFVRLGGVLSIAESYGAASAHKSESGRDRGVDGFGVVVAVAMAGPEELRLCRGDAAAGHWAERGGEDCVGSCSA